ncbi:MAG: type II toxin-antitoxin system RelE/ParE family toxin [Tannerella sp.]|jgi:plasmid stabilization system protein ParE|nr:type II toxin-antitoxin system RelE/ParE family toxin [Tannerella sp.]
MKFQQKGHRKTLKISNDYHEHLKDVALYGIETFGERVSREFVATIEVKVARLPLMPDANPKNRFLKSTERKIYRNIIVEKYIILYAVTKSTIYVIDIIHSAKNPVIIPEIAYRRQKYL